MAKFDPERVAHKAWLGPLQPVGVVVSPPALTKAQAVLDRNILPIQQALQAIVQRPASVYSDADPVLLDFPRFAREVLGWTSEDLAGAPGGPPVPEALAVALPNYGEILRPTYAALDSMGDNRPLLLIQVVDRGAALDKPPDHAERSGWHASPQARLERLLRDAGVPAGLLLNGCELRLVYAPRGESSGHIGFPISEMCGVSGRTFLSALHMLLSEHRVFSAPDGQRLLDLLVESRKYQSEVSNRLAEQVLGALWDLLRGFQAADEAANGRVLYDLARREPEQLYGGLLTVIMRLVFLLYAEDQGLMPDDPVYARNYAVGGLFERLREDAGRHPDTMDQRFGAWAGLLSTFRMVFDGGGHGGLRLPTRHGQLFNPDEYPFLESRPPGVNRVMGETFEPPRVSDGTVWRVLEGLLMLDGERLSYRSLDVEQIGSVYESMMGFDVKTVPGRAIAVRPKHIVVDLNALIAVQGAKRSAWLKEQAECDLSGASAKQLQDAGSAEDLVAALGRRVSPQTPHPLAPGALFLQPGEERRRSGSHYTPRELTEPIVRTTLQPVLEALGERPTPAQILELKVCDPAMGSGAFLVEACRQLAAHLVEAWQVHDSMPVLPPDEEALLYARRLIAQRCLYGVDKNRFAVNLAKLSLWLVTLARDHAFTFLDHVLKHGDSLVGLTRAQIGAFHWNPPKQDFGPLFAGITASLSEATAWRHKIQEHDEGAYDQRRAAWRESEDDLDDPRLMGDLCVAAFFGSDKEKEREQLRLAYLDKIETWKAGKGTESELRGIVDEFRGGKLPVLPFHWEIEFPEVFGRQNPGFDCFIGNPPFAGKNTLFLSSGERYVYCLVDRYQGAHGSSDLVAYFFRRVFELVRERGTFGLVATNSIAQGDTRDTGLGWICTHRGSIYAARRRVPWAGVATVVVSIVWIVKGATPDSCRLDERAVPRITSYLFHQGGNERPPALFRNKGQCFIGSYILGNGFLFADDDERASPISRMVTLTTKDRRNAERIFPFQGGEQINSSPTFATNRYVINFADMDESEARRWPDLMEIVEAKVRPERMKLGENGDARRRKTNWWRWGQYSHALFSAIETLPRVLVCSLVSKHMAFAWQPASNIFAHSLGVVAVAEDAFFAALSSRVHEVWVRFFSSSMKDDLRYTPSDCFETFPFPQDCDKNAALTAVGKRFCQSRTDVMVKNNEGLTKTYNRLHDPNECDPDILKLRGLQTAIDRAMLDAYGWADIAVAYEFLLDYDIDEDTWGSRKKPYRYRWPDAIRDEVLARLLDLNQKRHAEELEAGFHSKGEKGKPAAKKATKKTSAKKTSAKKVKPKATPLALFATGEGDE